MKKSILALLFFSLLIAPVCIIAQNNDDVYANTARLIDEGRYDEGIVITNTLLKENSKDPGAYILRGYCYSKKKMYKEAVRDFTAALNNTKPFDELYIHRADANLGAGNIDQSIEDCMMALALNNVNAQAHLIKGSCYSEKGMYDEALKDFNTNIKLDKNNVIGYIYRGQAYLIKAYFDKAFATNAIQDFSQAIRLNPKLGMGYQGRGNVYAFIGNYKQAITDLENAARVTPDDPAVYLDLMTALVRAGEINKAKKYYELVQVRNLNLEETSARSESWKFYSYYTKALTEGVLQDSFDKALADITTAERLYFDALKKYRNKYDMKLGFMDVTFLKGYALEQSGKLQDAKVAYEQALLLNANWTDLPLVIKRLDGKSEVAISTDKILPEIKILEPNTTRSFEVVSTNCKIIGRAVDASGIRSVTINGEQVPEVQEDGMFTHYIKLDEGKNNIVVEAVDKGGNKNSKTFVVNGSTTANPKVAKETAPVTGKKINFHAIIIAQQEYKDPSIPTLQFPIRDANEFKRILQTQYTFDPANIMVLENAARDEVLEAIMAKCRSLTDDDNLLIFYAGHGIAVKGEHNDVYPYWIPVTAKKDKYSTYINVQEVRTATKNSRARHILIIADACFAGAISRGVMDDAPIGLARRYELVSRKVMTSGNMETVPDNSKFMLYLKKTLQNNKQKYLSAFEIFSTIAIPVGNFEATPQYAAMPNTGDSGGDFVFIKR